MHQDHPNLSDAVNRNISESELQGGVWVHDHPDFVNAEIKAQPVLPVGATLKIQTRNTLYTLEKRGREEFWIQGHAKYCPVPTRCQIHGSTWGGSMLKMGFVGRGMHLEFSTDAEPRTIRTSAIQEVAQL